MDGEQCEHIVTFFKTMNSCPDRPAKIELIINKQSVQSNSTVVHAPYGAINEVTMSDMTSTISISLPIIVLPANNKTYNQGNNSCYCSLGPE